MRKVNLADLSSQLLDTFVEVEGRILSSEPEMLLRSAVFRCPSCNLEARDPPSDRCGRCGAPLEFLPRRSEWEDLRRVELTDGTLVVPLAVRGNPPAIGTPVRVTGRYVILGGEARILVSSITPVEEVVEYG
ncbi:MAG: hypothetical protein QW356_01995 [Candidatus Hadarchaeales archaeon]